MSDVEKRAVRMQRSPTKSKEDVKRGCDASTSTTDGGDSEIIGTKVSRVSKNILSTSSSLQEEDAGKYKRRAGPPKEKIIVKTDKRKMAEKDSDYELDETDREESSDVTLYKDKNGSSGDSEESGKEVSSDYSRKGSDIDERTDDDEHAENNKWTEIKAKRGKRRTENHDSDSSGKHSDGLTKGKADENMRRLIRKADAIENAIKESGNMKREAKKYITKILEGTKRALKTK
jgi:hypothetical protein